MTIHHSSHQPWKFKMSWNQGGGRGPFFKLLFPLLQHGQLKQLEEGAESTPLPPLPVPPAPTRTPHSPRLRSLPVVSLGLEANCGKKRAQLCPCGPSGRQSLRPVSAGSWTAARPRPSPHSRGAGARTKAQILPELRWLQWMTLHVAPPGHRLEGRVLLPNTQLSPAGPGAPGASGSLAPPDLQLEGASREGAQCCSHVSLGREQAAGHLSPSPAGWNKSQS